MYDQALLPQLETIFHDAAEDMVEHVGGGVEWDLINNRAADWARQATLDLETGLTENSKQIIQSGVADFYDQRLTLGALQDRLSRTFGPVRAEMIAITETTRAAAQGEKGYADELRKQGAVLKGVIETEKDEAVCAICAPLDGKDPEVEGYPPYHPRCRCNVRYEAVLPDDLETPVVEPAGPVTMPYGADIPADVGTPGRTPATLNEFLADSEGPLARALKGIDDDDFENSLLNLNFDTDQFEVNKDNVKYQADVSDEMKKYFVLGLSDGDGSGALDEQRY